MTIPSWSLELSVDGETRAVYDVAVEETSEVDLRAVDPSYVPRVFRIALPFSLVRAGAALTSPSSMGAILRYGSTIISTSPVTSYEFGPDGTGSVITMEDRPRPLETAFPDTSDMRIKYLDVKATTRAERIAEARARYWQWHKRTDDGDVKRLLRPKPFNLAATWVDEVYGLRVEGRVFPVGFNRPGRDGTPAVQALPVDASARLLMVLGHESIYGTVTLHRVEDGTDVTTSTQTTEYAEISGRGCTVINLFSNPGGVVYDDSVQWFVSFDGTASGIEADAADVIGLLAGRVRGIDVDLPSLEAARAWFRGWKIDTALTAQSSPWDLLTGSLLPLLPVSLAPTPKGVGLVRLPVLGDSRPVLGLTEGRTIFWNREPVRMDDQGIVTQWTIRYAYNALTGSYARAYTAGPQNHAEAASESTQSSSMPRTLDCPWVYDDATAQLIARSRVARTAQRYIRIGYNAVAAIHGAEGSSPLSAGDVVAVTDAGFGFDARPAIVESVYRRGQELRIVLAC